MVDRSKPRTMPHRMNVPWRVYDAINRRSCLHIDAWIIQSEDDDLFLVVETSIGGQHHLAQTVHALKPGEMIQQFPSRVDVTQYLERYVDSPQSRKRWPWLNALHVEKIQPMLHEHVEGFKGYRSIRLHYVYSNPKIHNPFEGVRNYWNVTGYGEAWGAAPDGPMTPDEIAATKPKRSPWSREDRSRLSTLDKLLK